jgi:ABC-type branched-subunit amino acid transport system substrate-binding protein
MFVRLLIFLAIIPLCSAERSALAYPLEIAVVESGLSATTSNPSEGNLRKGAQLALGNQIVPTWVDQGETAKSTLEAISKINLNDPKILVGMGSSFQALIADKKLNPSILLVTPLATSDEILNSRRILMVSNSNGIQAKLLAAEINNRIKRQERILIIDVMGCSYCTNMARLVLGELAKSKVKLTVIPVHEAQLDQKIDVLDRAVGFDHIVLPVLESQAAKLIEFLHLNNPNALYWGGDGWGTLARFIRELPYARTLRALWLSHYHIGVQTPENRAFVKRFREHYRVDPIDTSAQYFEATKLAISILKDKKSSSWIEHTRKVGGYPGLTGWVRFVGNHVERPMPLLEMKDGQIKLVKVIQLENHQ